MRLRRPPFPLRGWRHWTVQDINVFQRFSTCWLPNRWCMAYSPTKYWSSPFLEKNDMVSSMSLFFALLILVGVSKSMRPCVWDIREPCCFQKTIHVRDSYATNANGYIGLWQDAISLHLEACETFNALWIYWLTWYARQGQSDLWKILPTRHVTNMDICHYSKYIVNSMFSKCHIWQFRILMHDSVCIFVDIG